MKILLHDNHLGLRGTTVALYDYAYFLKHIYGYECGITYNQTDSKNDQKVINKFKYEFELYPYLNFNEVDNTIKLKNFDVFYAIKAGNKDGIISKNAKNIIHSVFESNTCDIHGDVYAYVSEWLSDYCSNKTIPYVPHMVNLPQTTDNYRKILNIPTDSIVFGRYGGLETFDIPFVLDVINSIIQSRKDIYFLFCNTYQFIDHPNVIFVNNTSSLENKVKFINTCDALLHARYRGETFGLTVLEFMSKNKPVLTYGLSKEQHHYWLLKDKGLIYNNFDELKNLVVNFTPASIVYDTLNQFIPHVVIKQFHDVFLTH